MGAVQKVLIVGGGIGGMTAAIALRAKGIDVDVVEKNDVNAVLGIGIILQGNALRALDQIGLFDEVRKEGFAFDNFVFFHADGSNPRPLPGGRIAGSDLPAMAGIPRPVLSNILTDAAVRAGANIRYKLSVSSIEDKGDSVDVVLTDGTSASYDFVIGADGIYSRVRELVFGEAGAPVFSGQAAWRVNFPRIEEIDSLFIFDSGHGDKAGFVPLSQDLMYMFVTDTTASAVGPEGNPHAALRERLASYGGLVGRYRDNLSDDDQIVWKRFEIVDLPDPWYKGRVAIIGDGAHASTAHLGQGGAMALEDAIVLAEELARPVEVEQALEGFMNRRLRRCNLIKTWSEQICKWEREKDPQADYVGLTAKAFELVQEPI